MTTRGKVVLFFSLGLGVLAVFALGAAVVWSFIKGAKKGATDADRQLVVTVQRLRDMGIETPDPDCCGQVSAIPNFGQRMISYTYNTPADVKPALYLHSQSEVMSSVSAIQSFRLTLLATRTTMATGGKRFEERPSLLTYGDDNYAAVMFNERNEPIGNLFAFRKGGFTVMVTIIGVYFDDAERVTELFEPVVSAIESRRRK